MMLGSFNLNDTRHFVYEFRNWSQVLITHFTGHFFILHVDTMSTDSTVPYAEFGGEKKPFNTLRIWKVLTLISTLVPNEQRCNCQCYALAHKTEKSGENLPEKSTSTADSLPCPQFPTLFPLPKPTPKRLTEVFEKLKAVFNAAVDENSSLPAISVNGFYQNRTLWSGHFGSKVYKRPEMKPNGSTVYRIGSVTKVFAVLLRDIPLVNLWGGGGGGWIFEPQELFFFNVSHEWIFFCQDVVHEYFFSLK